MRGTQARAKKALVMSNADKSYKIIAKRLKKYGIKDPVKVDNVITEINSIANLIIEAYINNKESK